MTAARSPRIAAVAALTVAALASSAPPSHAGLIVWQRGSDIYTMRDDGTSRTRLLGTRSVPGVSSIKSPHVASNGTTVVFEGSSASRAALGAGIYKLERGTAVTRLSWGQDVQPEAAGTSGRVVFAHREGGMTSVIRSLSLAGGDLQTFIPGCRGSGDLAADPSANPAQPEQVVYGGCEDAARQSRLFVSQASRVAERVLRIDDELVVDPSFAPDGSRIVAVESGRQPGIWAYPNGAGEPQRLLATPPGALPSSPRLIETGATERLLFAMHGDLWTVPTASCPCTFPADASRLTRDGTAVVDRSPAWTARTRLGGAAARSRSRKR